MSFEIYSSSGSYACNLITIAQHYQNNRFFEYISENPSSDSDLHRDWTIFRFSPLTWPDPTYGSPSVPPPPPLFNTSVPHKRATFVQPSKSLSSTDPQFHTKNPSVQPQKPSSSTPSVSSVPSILIQNFFNTKNSTQFF